MQSDLTRDANKIAGEAATAAKLAAEASKDAVELASDTAKKQLRAYVQPTKAEIRGLDGSRPLEVRVTARNSGQTPAYATIVNLQTWWEPSATAPQGPVGALPGEEGRPMVLAAGEEVYVDHTVVGDRRRDLRIGRAVLLVAGDVTYKDIYGVEHISRFEFVSDKDSPIMRLTGDNSSD